jgi:uncharacterized protein
MTSAMLPGSGSRCRVLGLLAKEPRPGHCKTRLARAASPEWAARVAAALLLDTVERLAAIDAHRVLAFAPPEAEDYFAEVARGRFGLIPQSGVDLGARMAAFFAEQMKAGADAVVLVGTDSPTLPRAFMEEAFQELERADVVLGPATDGGYYLIGLSPVSAGMEERQRERAARHPLTSSTTLPPIFDGMPWGTSRVLHDTMARLSNPAWRLALLPPWYDVDTLEDWRTLQGHVAALRRAGLDPGVPHTERLMQD